MAKYRIRVNPDGTYLVTGEINVTGKQKTTVARICADKEAVAFWGKQMGDSFAAMREAHLAEVRRLQKLTRGEA